MPRRPSAFLSRRTAHETYNDVLFIGLMAAFAWVPFLVGSNRLVAWGVNAVLFGALLILFEAGILLLRGRHAVAPRRLWWAFLLLAGVVGWILVQLAPWTPAGWHNPFWPLADELLRQLPDARPMAGSISATPDAGLRALVVLLTTSVAFYLALELCRDGRRADILLRFLVVTAVGYAAFGLVQYALAPDMLLWFERVAYVGTVTSTFVNKNNYATFAGIGLIAAIGLLIDVYRRAGTHHDLPVAMRAAALLDVTLRRALFILVGIGVITAALMLAQSRAGFVATLGGLAALSLLILFSSRRRWLLVAVGVPVFAVMLASMAFLGDDLAERFGTRTLSDLRWMVAERTLDAIGDAPLQGFGYGSFDRMFSVYRGAELFDSQHHWDKAHNTYLELVFELGVPAAGVLFLLCGGLLLTLLLQMLRREAPHMISLVALAASTIVLLHAAFDFSLQIQAIAILYWALVGAGLAQSWSRRIDTSS